MATPSLKISVGLEIHARLKTRRKIFCCCPNRYGDVPNSNTCPVCLGLPGSLPVLNPEIVEPALRAATALNCDIALESEFSRKNYFYPDLPRNFQITQYRRPLALGGYLEVGGLRVNLTRIHLEEDAGRILGSPSGNTRVDLNRAGAPLIEIVTEPDLQNGHQARQWLTRLRQILRYLDVCDGDMENGSLRCDANVGLLGDHDQAGAWVELKNLNSFKWVSQAVDFEIERLIKKVADGETLQRETRSWDPRKRITILLRLKEASADYRFFPEPDLPLLVVDSSLLETVAHKLPELPAAREKRFRSTFGLSAADAVTICRSLELGNYFESCAMSLADEAGLTKDDSGSLVLPWVLSQVLGAVGGRDDKLSCLSLTPEKLAEILGLLVSETIHRTQARMIVQQVLDCLDEVDLSAFVPSSAEQDQQNEELLDKYCLQVLQQHPVKAEALRTGKKGLLNFFIGQVISLCGGSFDAQKIRINLIKKLS